MKKWHIVSNILIVQERLGQNEFSGSVLMDKSLSELSAILRRMVLSLDCPSVMMDLAFNGRSLMDEVSDEFDLVVTQLGERDV